MDFLYKLYGNEYFGVILFTVIGILAFLFILILILGKIDEKKSKQAEQEAENAFKDVTPEAVAVEAPVVGLEPVVEVQPSVSLEAPVMEEVEANEPIPVEDVEESEEVIEPVTMPENDPFASSYLDLSEIEKSLNSTVEEPQVQEEVTFVTPEFPTEEKETVTMMHTSEPAKVTTVPDQFSSVYVNHSVDVPTTPVVDIPVMQEEPVNDMEFELPKKVGEATPVTSEVSAATPEAKPEEVPGLMMFPEIESETYDIDK